MAVVVVVVVVMLPPFENKTLFASPGQHRSATRFGRFIVARGPLGQMIDRAHLALAIPSSQRFPNDRPDANVGEEQPMRRD